MSALIILAQKDYQDIELDGTRKGLESAGHDIVIASTKAKKCKGKLGGREKATVALKDVVVDDYDVIAFIGGSGAAIFVDDPEAHRIAQEAVVRGKKLGAICISPAILAKAGVLKGKRATVWNGNGEQAGVLLSAGAEFTRSDVEVDGNIVTANGPDVAKKFGKMLA